MADLNFNEERCKGCGLCVTFCPKKCLHISERLNKQGYPVAEAQDLTGCTGCCFCAWMCPDVVITVRK